MYKQIDSGCSLKKHFFYKLHYFERLILQIEQFATDKITLVNNKQDGINSENRRERDDASQNETFSYNMLSHVLFQNGLKNIMQKSSQSIVE